LQPKLKGTEAYTKYNALGKDFEGKKEMKRLICNEGIAEKGFPSHVNIKHDGIVNPWKYIIAIQKNITASTSYMEC
jgi:hypothetical protein